MVMLCTSKLLNGLASLVAVLSLGFSDFSFSRSEGKIEYRYEYDLGLKYSIEANFDSRRRTELKVLLDTKNKIDPLISTIFKNDSVKVVFLDARFIIPDKEDFTHIVMNHYKGMSSGVKVKNNNLSNYSGMKVKSDPGSNICEIKSRWVHVYRSGDAKEENFNVYVIWDERRAVVDRMLSEYSILSSDYHYNKMLGYEYLNFINLYWDLRKKGISKEEVKKNIPLDLFYLFEKYDGLHDEKIFPYIDKFLSGSEIYFPSMVFNILNECSKHTEFNKDSVNYTEFIN